MAYYETNDHWHCRSFLHPIVIKKKELAINRLSSLRHCSAAALLAIARSRGRGDDGGGGNSYVSLPYPCAYQASSSIIIIIRTGKEEQKKKKKKKKKHEARKTRQ